MTADQVENILKGAWPESQVKVSGEGAKFHVWVRADRFAGLSPVRQQQLVYGCLQEHISSGDIHAVTMDLGAEDHRNG
jgi:acid stress-induced BolA-like protein IbaG/YrbA